jgi:hypothetical protein
VVLSNLKEIGIPGDCLPFAMLDKEFLDVMSKAS